jgi:hypothetical protein
MVKGSLNAQADLDYGGLLVALLVALPVRRVPSTAVAPSSNQQHAYLHLHSDDDLIAKP